MKKYITAIICASVLGISATANAAGGFQELLNGTQKDFDAVKKNFRAAYTSGYGSWAEYEKATGFSLVSVENRIVARRERLALIERSANTSMDPSTRGLAKMVIRDLDDVNLSILALIRDDKGYAGYIRTQDSRIVDGVNGWQEGIRIAIKEAGRCVKMVRMVAGQLNIGTEILPVFVH